MNLFHNTELVQAIRNAFELTPPQAQAVLIAYQHRSVSSQTIRKVFDFTTERLSGSQTLSKPVRKGLLKSVGKVRSPGTGKISTVYVLDKESEVQAVIDKAAEKNVETFLWINSEESHLQNEIMEADSEDN